VVSFTAQTPGYTLHTSKGGNRHCDVQISFSSPFYTQPQVFATISGFDGETAHNLRLKVNAHQVTPQGFQLRAETWADSRLDAVTVSWIAFVPGPQIAGCVLELKPQTNLLCVANPAPRSEQVTAALQTPLACPHPVLVCGFKAIDVLNEAPVHAFCARVTPVQCAGGQVTTAFSTEGGTRCFWLGATVIAVDPALLAGDSRPLYYGPSDPRNVFGRPGAAVRRTVDPVTLRAPQASIFTALTAFGGRCGPNMRIHVAPGADGRSVEAQTWADSMLAELGFVAAPFPFAAPSAIVPMPATYAPPVAQETHEDHHHHHHHGPHIHMPRMPVMPMMPRMPAMPGMPVIVVPKMPPNPFRRR
jgi:hypothetical protein